MEITEERRENIFILRVIGRLDSSTSKTMEERLLSVIDSGERRLVIELSQLDYVSSAGLRVFLLAAKRMGNANGKMALCSLKDVVKQVFDIAGFSSILAIAGSAEDAINNL